MTTNGIKADMCHFIFQCCKRYFWFLFSFDDCWMFDLSDDWWGDCWACDHGEIIDGETKKNLIVIILKMLNKLLAEKNTIWTFSYTIEREK